MEQNESQEPQAFDPLSSTVYTTVRGGNQQEKETEHCDFQLVPVEHVTYATLLPNTHSPDDSPQSSYYTFVTSHGSGTGSNDTTHPIVLAVATSNPSISVAPSSGSNQPSNENDSQEATESQQTSLIASIEEDQEGIIVAQDVSVLGTQTSESTLPGMSVLVQDQSPTVVTIKNAQTSDNSVQSSQTVVVPSERIITVSTSTEANSEHRSSVDAQANRPVPVSMSRASVQTVTTLGRTGEPSQVVLSSSTAPTVTKVITTASAAHSKDSNSDAEGRCLRSRLQQARLKARPYEVVVLPQKRQRAPKITKAADPTFALINVERARLAVERERLAVEKERLQVERERLIVEKERLALEKGDVIIPVTRGAEA